MSNRFIVDCMLGKLAKWLRFAGDDIIYINDASDKFLIKLAVEENRILITRDKKIYESLKGRSVLLFDSTLDLQLCLMFKMFKHNKNEYLTRCSICNTLLVCKNKNEVEKIVPAQSFIHATYFYYCTTCNKVYWNGTHFERISKKLECLNEKCSVHAEKTGFTY